MNLSLHDFDQTVDTSVQLSVIIPTYNEAGNIVTLLQRLLEVLAPLSFEIIVVDDDSPDRTWEVAGELAQLHDEIHVVRRFNQKGLSSAVITGFRLSRGQAIAVMDSDLQHDEAILPAMAEKVLRQSYDICVGSREARGGSYGVWSRRRKIVSHGAKWLANRMVGNLSTDPMSGYFVLKRSYYEATVEQVNPSGFKILLEFLVRGSQPSVAEVGYTFRTRIHGETKLNSTVMIEYVLALIDLRFGWLIPSQFVRFAMVGLTGSLINFIGFAVARAIGMPMVAAVVTGVELAIIWTYLLNNWFTFSPARHVGRTSLFRGFVIYQTVCCYGLVVQLSVVTMLLQYYPQLGSQLWSLYLVYLCGVAFASIGNFLLHSYFTWSSLGFNVLRPRRAVIQGDSSVVNSVMK